MPAQIPPDDSPGTTPTAGLSSKAHIALTERFAAHNYHPLPVVLSRGEGAWVVDVEGRRYLDCLAGYSALNFGHSHPRLVARAREQMERLTLTSRAFYNDQLGPFVRDLAALTGKDQVLPMNTGAEAVETAIKVARRWGQERHKTDPDRTNIIVMGGNFHGRTTTIVSFTTDEEARRGYGPYTPGFRIVPFGDIGAVQAAMDGDTVAVLVEPIQGERGVVMPPPGYLVALRALCTANNVLLIADEIQSGLGRAGATFACDLENVVPDIYVMGKALGGGLVPVSAITADADVLSVIVPGSHGSTFGGNPLAAAVGHEVVAMLNTGEFQERARTMGALLADGLASLPRERVEAVRCQGLWAGIDIDPGYMTGRQMCEGLLAEGVLAKDAHSSTIRLAPPLVVTAEEVERLVEALRKVLGAVPAT